MLERHLVENPRNAGALMTLSRLARSVGDITKSVETARRACGLSPHAAPAWSVLADALLAAGAMAEAQDAAARSFAIEPSSYAIDRMMQALPNTRERSQWLRGQWKAALEQPRSPERLLALVYSSAPPLSFDELAELTAQCDTTPEYEQIHAELVRLALRMRDFNRAVETSGRFLELYAHNERAHALRYEALSESGRTADATAAAKRWSAEFPHSTRPLWALADICLASQDDDAALVPLEGIVALQPTATQPIVTLACALLRLKRAPEGLARLDELWRHAPSAEVGWHRVDFAVEIGDREAVEKTIHELIPHLHDLNDTLRSLNERTKTPDWVRRIWREALERVDDASPPGARAAWAFVTVGRHSVEETFVAMRQRFTASDAIDDALQALVFVATYRDYHRLAVCLLKQYPEELKRRSSSFIEFADSLWVAERRRDARRWLASWNERDDLVADKLRLVARILDALGDHDGAVAAARRGLPLAENLEFSGFLTILAVALAGKRDARSLNEARVLFQRVLEVPASKELLDTPGRPGDTALANLAAEARALRKAEACPIVRSLHEAFGELFIERGCSRFTCTFARSWWRTLDDVARRGRKGVKMLVHHSIASLAAPFRRLMRSERTRFDGI